MNFGIVTNTPILQRVPLERNTNDKITNYGADNLYPQRIKQTLLLSPIAKSAVGLMANFIRGDGFERGDKIINDQNQTANDVLQLISEDQALYNAYCLHINSTGLGISKGVEFVEFENVRLGLVNQSGNVNDCKVSINWQQSNQVLPNPEINASRFILFDKAKQGEEALTTGKGMILYASPKKNQYPLASIDSILETCQADYELQLFELGNITNGFLSMSIVKFLSGGDTQDEEEDLKEKLNGFKGSRNANSVIVVSQDEDSEFTGNMVEQIPANNNDSLFINTTLNIKNRIINAFAIPNSLLGMLPLGTLFSAQQIADDYTYMNLRTKDTRNQIERVFNETLGLNVGKITPNQFESSQMQENQTPV